jgi:ribonucleotide reductase beta subunit family protein with ferritin-like domain
MQHFVSHIVGFFLFADNIVNANLMENFQQEVKIHEARCFFNIQAANETIHAETYALLFDMFVSSDDDKAVVLDRVKNTECIQAKTAWAIKYKDPESASFASRLVVFCCVEGIHFSSSFASIYFIKTLNILPALVDSNEYIARDEGLHLAFACDLYDYLVNKLTEGEAHAIIKEAAEIEILFATSMLQKDGENIIAGLSLDDMVKHIKMTANSVCRMLKYANVYPLPETAQLSYVRQIDLALKHDFFARKNFGTYSKVKAPVGGAKRVKI